MKELREKLQEIAEAFIEAAKAIRTEDPVLSFKLFRISETAKKASEEMERLEPKETETEGGGSSWWKVCPECHGTVGDADRFCRHCGQALKAE